MNKYILELSQVGINDIEKVGGKNASLGEMIQNLTALGINIPNGFVVTVNAYRDFLESNHLESPIRNIIDSIEYESIKSLRRSGQQIRLLLKNGRFPKEMSERIIKAYEKLSSNYNQD